MTSYSKAKINLILLFMFQVSFSKLPLLFLAHNANSPVNDYKI